MVEIKYFIATAETHTIDEGQKVWVTSIDKDMLNITFKYRGDGIYTKGTIGYNNALIGEIRTVQIGVGFAKLLKDPKSVDEQG